MNKIRQLIQAAQGERNTGSCFSDDNPLQYECDLFNQARGSLEGVDCPKCLNKGFVAEVQNGYVVNRECSCMTVRRNAERIHNSGLSDVIEQHTFDKFVVTDEWQKKIKYSAVDFVKSPVGRWFYIGGQVGCGKTHICTAIVAEMMKRGRSAKYMLWRDDVVQLKANIMDDFKYNELISRFKLVDVLYIDDFFKTEAGKRPTTSDINIAFELINYRYNNRNLVTIISSENTVRELMDIDEAVGSRIYQRSKDSSISISKGRDKNYRLRV